MKHILYSLLFCLALTSCEEREASGPGATVTRPVSAPIIAPSTTPVIAPSATQANAGTVPVNNVVTTTATTPKLNPAHGQPGHRCDIAVGAPLTGGPVQNAKSALPASPAINPAVQTAPILQTKTAAPSITTAAVAPGINPAHGQPGHRCDVAVGAAIPKTAVSNVKPAITSSPVAVPPVLQNSPILPQAATTATTVASGLNPAHGQPGHRCDIAVGKPLNSAPKKN
jgi:hypothetical protein